MNAYANYKPTGDAWLGKVPSHWDVKVLKRLGCFRSGAAFPLEAQGLPNNPLPFYKVKDLDAADAKGVMSVTDSTITYETANTLGAKVLPAGTIVFAKVGAALLLNRFRVLGSNACIDNNMMGFVLMEDEACPRFFWWAMQRINFATIVNPGTVPSLNEPKVSNISIAVPPITEQQDISDYLDAETTRIDELIRDKEALLGLLQESLDGTFEALLLEMAAKKPGDQASSFPWLPQMPADWIRVKVKHVVESIDQGISPQCEAYPPGEDDWGVLKVGCVNTGAFDPLESKTLPSDIEPIEEITLKQGDVLASRANTKKLVGRAAMVDKDYPRLMLSDKLYRMKVDQQRCMPEFLVGILALSAVRVRIEERATGASASMLNIDRRTILELDFPLPTIEEQKQIITAVQSETERLNDLINHVEKEIKLLNELRAATVADAVLGRVDVRNYAIN